MIYLVVSWNGKDGQLINEVGDLRTLAKQELPSEFGGFLVPGEPVEIDPPRLPGKPRTVKQKQKMKALIYASSRIKELWKKEQNRRAQYGVKA